MARSRGRTKPARLTVNLDPPPHTPLVEIARPEVVSGSWVVMRAIEAFVARDGADNVLPAATSVTNEGNRLKPTSEDQ